MSTEVSLIIATLNREQPLVDTLVYALDQEYPSYEVIVVDQTDQHQPDVAKELARLAKDPHLTIIQEQYKSLPNARNVGIAKSVGQYLIFIDDDVILDKKFIANHLQFMKAYGALAVAGRVVQDDRPLVSEPITVDRFGRVKADGFSGQQVRQVDTFRGCNMAIHRHVFEQCGLFDVNYTGSAIREETDLAMRITKAGIPILFNPQASLIHLEDSSGGCNMDQAQTVLPRDQRPENYKNEAYFFLKHGSKWLLPIYVAGMFKAYVFKPRFMSPAKLPRQMAVVSSGLTQGLSQYFKYLSQGNP